MPHESLGDFLDELEGWSTTKMARTVGKLLHGADNIATRLAQETCQPEFDARVVKDLSGALKLVANAMQHYTGMYQWAMQQTQQGRASLKALDELFPYLDGQEMRTLQTWLRRLDPVET